MRINWFSPVPPVRSGIARVTAGVLPALARRADMIVWSSEQTWSAEIEEFAEVRHYSPDNPPWRELNEADATIYHLGNDPRYHAGIWRVSRQHPGIVVLHDLKLQHFFAGLVSEVQVLSLNEYLALIEQHHGAAGRGFAEAYLRGTLSLEELAEECSLVGAAVENALAVAVHSRAAYDELAKEQCLPVAYIPLAAASAAPKRDPEADPSHERGRYRIIMFGYLGPNRRIDGFLKAMARFPDRARFQVDIFGTLETAEATRHLICNLGLQDCATLHGFVTEEQLEDALAASDLAVNLRYPSVGEASASQLRLWQYELPALVNETGWYATVPRDTVAFVRPEHEAEDIHEHLAGFLADPGRYRQLGRNGRRHVDAHHSIDGYADSLVELAAAVPRLRALWSARDLSFRIGGVTDGWCAEENRRPVFERVSEEIRALTAGNSSRA